LQHNRQSGFSPASSEVENAKIRLLEIIGGNPPDRSRSVKKLERPKDKHRMMVRFDEEAPSGAAFGLRDRDGESAASAAE